VAERLDHERTANIGEILKIQARLVELNNDLTTK
jgi:hypothetical protein